MAVVYVQCAVVTWVKNMIILRALVVASLSSAYVVPLRSAHRLTTLRRRAAPAAVPADQNATEFGAGLVSGGAAVAPSPLQQLSDAFGLKDASDAVAWTEPLSALTKDADPLSAIAPDFTSSLSFSTPEVATPTRRLSLLRQRRKPRSAAASRAVRRRRALERERAQERDFEFLQRAQFVSLVLPPVLAFALWPTV